MSRAFSPYDLNPMGFNPLRQILAESIDFERLIASPIKLFITATNVHTGRGRIFRNSQITPDVLLASACLPTMFQAVEIEGEAYWDGGFAGNPTITPRMIPSWSRSIRTSGRIRRGRRAISSTVSTRFPSTRRS
jgi:NTE family protein